jgi:cytochrome c5
MTALRNIAIAALLVGVGPTMTPACAQVPTDSSVREMRQRLQTLQQQLDQLNSTRDPPARQRLMQQNWQGMQDYMGWMRRRWGVGYPWMTGYQGTGCPMCGGQMIGGSAGVGWQVPQGMSPATYWQQMRDHTQVMQQQISGIAQSTDSLGRQRLLQEHWQDMYQHMQTMRGMGWMWAGPMMPGMMWRPMPGAANAQPLPEPESRGATLVTTYCTQCHAAPSPSLHTAADWANVTSRMQLHMSSGLSGIKTPTEEEMRMILAYMQQHAR